MELDDLMKLPKAKKEELINEFKKAAETGHVESMVGLANCYLNGVLVEKNLKQAFKYYKMASDKGNLKAKYNLLYMYLTGEGVDKNNNEAKKLMVDLEKSKDGEVLYNLGTVYELGNLGSVDLQKAFDLYLKSANLGNDKGQIKVGNFYAEGKLFKADWNIAVEWWTKAAKQGNEIALQMLKELIEVQTERMNSGVSSESLESTKPAKNASKPAKNASKPAKTQEKVQEVIKEDENKTKYELVIDYKKYNENKKKYIDEFNVNLQKAESGDSDAMYKVGESYYLGFFGLYDIEKARYWFEKAVEAGNFDGYIGLGRFEYFTYNYKRDHDKATQYFTLAADKGSLLAKKWLARINLYFKDTEAGIKELQEIAQMNCSSAYADLAYYYLFDKPDIEKAEVYVNKAVELKDSSSAYLLASLYYQKKEYDKYLEEIVNAIEEGDKYAEEDVGIKYYNGTLFEKDYIKAFNWLQRAVVSGNINALFNLGICYQFGYGSDKDDKKALECYELSAKRGNFKGLQQAGHYYLLGRGCEMDEAKAFFLYKMAVDRGCEDAYCDLGGCYLNGYGCEVDKEKAFYYMEKGAEFGDVLAMYNLGCFYDDGIACEVDKEKAFYWYNKAADTGDVKSIHQVGFMLLNGIGCEVDTKQAFKMFEKAANEGYGESVSMLGACYTQGSGVEINAEKAFYYHEKAAELGVATSMLCCALCYQSGNGVKQDYLKAVAYHISAMKNGCMIGYSNFVDFILKVGISKKFYTGVVQQLEEVEHELVWYLIGEFYCKGELVDQDYVKAYKYLTMACEKGYKEAIELCDMVFTKDGSVKNYIKTNTQKKEVIVDLSDDNIIMAKELINKGYSLLKFTTSNAVLTYIKKGHVDKYIQAVKYTGEVSSEKLQECKDAFIGFEKDTTEDQLLIEVGKLISISYATAKDREWQLENIRRRFAPKSQQNK